MGEQLDLYYQNLVDTREIIFGVSEKVSFATDALGDLDRAIDKIQDLSTDADKLETLVENLSDVVGFLRLFPLTRSIARKMQDVIDKVEKRIEDIREDIESVEEILTKYDTGVTILKNALKAFNVDLGQDVTDIETAFTSIENTIDVLAYTAINRPDEFDAVEADLEAQIQSLNALFPQAQVDAALAAAQTVFDVFANYAGATSIISLVQNALDDVFDAVSFLDGPLNAIADELKPLTYVLDKAEEVIDAIVSPFVDPILDTLGVNDLVDDLAQSITGLLPSATVLDYFDDLEIDLQESLGVVPPEDASDIPIYTDLRNKFDALVAEVLGENGYLGPLFDDGTTAADFLAGRNSALNDDNTIDGLAGRDVISGGEGDDTLTGGADDDILIGGQGDDVIDGGEGIDVYYLDGDFSQFALDVDGETLVFTHIGTQKEDQGSDRVRKVEWISFAGNFFEASVLAAATSIDYDGPNGNQLTGTNDGELLIGGFKADNIQALGGDDNIIGLWGADPDAVSDTIDGGDGIDTVQYATANPLNTGAFVILDLSLTNELSRRTDVLTNIENILGSILADTIVGDAGANRINGLTGADLLVGGGGNDSILAGSGNSTIVGGSGDDAIVIEDDNGENVIVGGRGDDIYGGDMTPEDIVVYGLEARNIVDGSTVSNLANALLRFQADGESDLPQSISLTVNPIGFQVEKTFLDGEVGTDTFESLGRLIGSNGNDTFALANRTVLFDGGLGDDLFTGFTPDRLNDPERSNSLLYGGGGNDTLVSYSVDEHFVGGGGDDTYVVAATRDVDFETEQFEVRERFFFGGMGPLPDLDDDAWGFRNVEVFPRPYDGYRYRATENATDAGFNTLDLSQSDQQWLGSFFRGDFQSSPPGSLTPKIDKLYVSDIDRVIASDFGTIVFWFGTDLVFEGGAGRDRLSPEIEARTWGSPHYANIEAYGRDGNDRLVAGLGMDTIEGGAGNDEIWNDGNLLGLEETLFGGSGNDLLGVGQYGFETGTIALEGGEGVDTAIFDRLGDLSGLFSQTYAQSLSVDLGSDVYSFDEVRGTIRDIDNVISLNQNSNLIGNANANALSAYTGENFVSGGQGNDVLVGGVENDTIFGGTGNDLINPNSGGGIADGGDGFDQLSFNFLLGYDYGESVEDLALLINRNRWLTSESRRVDGMVVDIGSGTMQRINSETLQFFNFEAYTGSPWDDTILAPVTGQAGETGYRMNGAYGRDFLQGSGADDTIDGGGGGDITYAGGGDDQLFAGTIVEGLELDKADRANFIYAQDGFDTLSFSLASTNLKIAGNLATADNWLGATFRSIEALRLSNNADLVIGLSGEDDISGLDGNDTLSGAQGADTISGGAGDDLIRGQGTIMPRRPDLVFINQDVAKDDYLIARNIAMPTAALTVEMMLQGEKPTTFYVPISYGVTNSTNEFTLFVSGSETAHLLLNGDRITTDIRATELFDGTPHRLSITWETDGDLSFFIDGLLRWRDRPDLIVNDNPITSGGDFVFGQDQDGGTPGVASSFEPSQAMVGGIGDIRIFSTVISDELIAERAFGELDSPLTTDNLIHYWRVDADTNEVLTLKGAAISARGNVAYQSGNPDFSDGADVLAGDAGNDTVYGEAGGDTLLGGIGDDMLIGDDPEEPILPLAYLNMRAPFTDRLENSIFVDMPSSAMTVEMMVDAIEAKDRLYTLMSYATDQSDNTFSVYADVPNDQLVVWINSTFTRFDASAIDLMTNGPRLLSLTWDSANGLVKIFYDGVNMAEAVGPAGFTQPIANNGYLVFGQDQDTVGGNFDERQSFRGGIGEIRIFDAVQSEADILARAAGPLQGNASEIDDLVAYYTVSPGQTFLSNPLGIGLQATPKTQFPLNTAPAGGDDVIEGGDGQDTIYGNDGSDSLSGGADNDRVFGGAGDDTLSGGSGNDRLTGGDDNDRFVLGGGRDTVDGGAGRDRLVVTDATEYAGLHAVVDLVAGRVSGSDGQSSEDDQFFSIEDIEFNANIAARIIGNSLGNYLGAAGGDDTVFAGGGADTVESGTGDDVVDGGGGADSIRGFGGNDLLIGGTGKDTLVGSLDNDTLVGGVDADALNGGDGFDWASYATAVLALRVDLQAPITNSGDAFGDVLISIENLLGSDQRDFFYGDDADNVIDTGGANDLLSGRAGNDTLRGGDGDDFLAGGLGADLLDGGNSADFGDWAQYNLALGGIVADLRDPGTNTGEAAGDTYVSIENLFGSQFGDTLRGDGEDNFFLGLDGDDSIRGRNGDDYIIAGKGNDTLDGGADNDTLLGGDGADDLIGGAGVDRAQYSKSASGLTADLAQVINNTGEAAGDRYFDIEDLYGTFFDDTLRGNDQDNEIRGVGGADLVEGRGGNDLLLGGGGFDDLDGGAGADTLSGGDGSDTALYASAGTGLRADLVAGGTNTGDAAGDVYASIENLTGSAFDDGLYGTDGANRLIGSAGDDTLVGRGGADRIFGGAGEDVMNGGSGDDLMIGGAGFDLLLGGAGSDTLTGGDSFDLFVFQDGFGSDTVTDFDAQDDAEVLNISALSDVTYAGDFAAFQAAHLSDVGGAVLFVAGSNSILLEAVTLSDLDAFDFIF